jgi:hypothetical protein
MKRELTLGDIPISTAPKGFTGKVKFVSMEPSGMQSVIIGQGDKPNLKDKKFLIENSGVRQLAGATDDFKDKDVEVTVYTGKEGWDRNMIVGFNVVGQEEWE